MAAPIAVEPAITDLGTLPGDTSAVAYGINDAGRVVGASYSSSGVRHAFLWQDGVMKDLGTFPGGTYSSALGINEVGQVVGWGDTSSGAHHAFVWQDGVMTDLGTLPGGTSSYARGINDAGQVVGFVIADGYRAFLWQDGVMTDLGTLPGYTSSFAEGINSSGAVVGLSKSPNDPFPEHAFLWQDGVMTDLGTLRNGVYAGANGINDAGQVVGTSETPAEEYVAFLWQDGVMTDLGNLGGGESGAYGINETGAIVGWSDRPNQGADRAFLWQGGVMTDLGTLSGDLSAIAYGINDLGQIAGQSSDGTTSHAVLWTGPYPPPPPPLSAMAFATPSATDVGLAITFRCTPTGGTPPYTVTWDFDDGTAPVSGATVSHAYTSPGTKTVTCMVDDDAGQTTGYQITMEIYPAPSATASVARRATSPGRPLEFTANATGGSGGYRYHWEFGDNATATGSKVTHTYESGGVYSAVVIVRDSVGGTATSSVTVTVASLVVMATASTASASTGQTITFIASATGGTGGPYTFTWEFGDGSTATGAAASHVYEIPGSYAPKVTVVDESGARDERELTTITVVRATEEAPAGGLGPVVIGAVGVAIAVGVTVAVYAMRRNGPRP